MKNFLTTQTLVFMSNAVEAIESSVTGDFFMTFSATLPKIVSSKLTMVLNPPNRERYSSSISKSHMGSTC